jgi:hypothetical protein
MKATFKPLSLAIAVSAATAGYVGTVNAQAVVVPAPALAGNTGLGDLAIVPYYTVREDWTTGVSVINTSSLTQVIKVRLRRATDSMDALDFNVVMSPNDVWTGYIENNKAPGVEDQVRFYTNDNTCTVPIATPNPEGGPGYFAVPDVFADFAEEGYIEIIGMGAANATQPISRDALHSSEGFPLFCDLLQANFRAFGTRDVKNAPVAAQPTPLNLTLDGNISSTQTYAQGRLSNYTAPGNFMKVSYFIKDTTSGIEMGDNAVLVSDFMDGASMTNQLPALAVGEDLQGYDFPDLDGGAPLSAGDAGAATTGRFQLLRNILSSTGIINDWSKNDAGAFTVDTDWVITAPGQYTMLKTPRYLLSLADGYDAANAGPNLICGKVAIGPVTRCDYRDLPLRITPLVFDREEQSEVIPPDEIVISPTPSTPRNPDDLVYEVNVIEWGNAPVLDAAASLKLNVDLAGAQYGWANIALSSRNADPRVCAYPTGTAGVIEPVCNAVTGQAPIVGFAAWQRNFTANPDANYGRIIRHSYTISSS